MKVITAVSKALVILSFAVVLAACGGDDPTTAPVTPATATPVPVTTQAPVVTAAPTATPTLAPGQPTPTPAPATPTPMPTPTATLTIPSFDATEYFSGEAVRLVVSSNPGGTTDLEGRILAKFMGDYIPGDPRVIVSNIPRLPGYHAAYEADPDGLTIGMTATGDLQIRRMILPEARYDVSKFQHLGTMGSTPSLISMTADLGYADVYAAMAAGPDAPNKIIFTRNVPGALNLPGTELALGFICDQLGLPCKFINIANDTSAQMLVMLERGEITGYARRAWGTLPTLRPGWWEQGLLVPLFNMNPGIDPGPNAETGQPYPAPGIDELLSEEAYERVIAMQGTGFLSKNYWYGPGVPAEVVRAMRDVFVAISRDPEFNDTMLRVADVDLDGGNNYLTGEETDRIQQEGTQAFLDTQDQLAGWQEEYFNKYWR